MDLKERVILHRQTAEAIEAWEKDNNIKLEGSNVGDVWIIAVPNWASTFYRVAKPEPKKVTYYRPIILLTNGEICVSHYWQDNKTIIKVDGIKNTEPNIIGWDERTFEIPEEE